MIEIIADQGIGSMCLAKTADWNIMAVEVFRPLRHDFVSLVEEAAVVTKRLGKFD